MGFQDIVLLAVLVIGKQQRHGDKRHQHHGNKQFKKFRKYGHILIYYSNYAL